jgi:hypothetical protein
MGGTTKDDTTISFKEYAVALGYPAHYSATLYFQSHPRELYLLEKIGNRHRIKLKFLDEKLKPLNNKDKHLDDELEEVQTQVEEDEQKPKLISWLRYKNANDIHPALTIEKYLESNEQLPTDFSTKKNTHTYINTTYLETDLKLKEEIKAKNPNNNYISRLEFFQANGLPKTCSLTSYAKKLRLPPDFFKKLRKLSLVNKKYLSEDYKLLPLQTILGMLSGPNLEEYENEFGLVFPPPGKRKVAFPNKITNEENSTSALLKHFANQTSSLAGAPAIVEYLNAHLYINSDNTHIQQNTDSVSGEQLYIVDRLAKNIEQLVLNPTGTKILEDISLLVPELGKALDFIKDYTSLENEIAKQNEMILRLKKEIKNINVDDYKHKIEALRQTLIMFIVEDVIPKKQK